MGGFIISDEFRINSLSLEEGGSTVFVIDHTGRVNIYRNVKKPWHYIKRAKKKDPSIKDAWFETPKEPLINKIREKFNQKRNEKICINDQKL